MTMILINTSIVAFISSVLGGILPIKKSSIRHYRWMHYMDSLCDGMFIAIATTHLIPEIYEHSASTADFGLYSLVILAIVGIVHLPTRTEYDFTKHWVTYLLFAHCLIEGLAVSLVHDASLQATLSLTILAHKAIESFVFFNLITRQEWSQRSLVLLLIVFSGLTPLGIILGQYLTTFPPSISLWTNILTAATFLGISANCLFSKSCNKHSHHEKIWMVLGFLALALVFPTGHAH
jgi:zinc transporter ZupT